MRTYKETCQTTGQKWCYRKNAAKGKTLIAVLILKFKKILKSGDFAEMEITLASEICIELWDEVKELSRIVLRYSSDTIAIGKAIKILTKQEQNKQTASLQNGRAS